MTKAPKRAAPASKFQAVRPRRLGDQIADQIRDLLKKGDLKSGDRLPSERDLAAQLQVGRGAVREGLRVLEAAGFLTTQLGGDGGASIGTGDPSIVADRLRDLFSLRGITLDQLIEARKWVSTLIVTVVCERATEEDFAEMEANIAAAEEAFARGDLLAKLEHTVEFNNIIARATKNPVIFLLMDSVMDLMRDFAQRVGTEENDEAMRSRRRLMKHLRRRNTKAAIAEMSDYLERLQKRYLKYLKEAE